MESIREIREGLQEQGVQEEITYTLTTTAWGAGTPSSVDVKGYSVTEGNTESYADVTSTIFPVNSPTPSSGLITLSPAKSMTENVLYRIEIKFTLSGNIFEAYAYIRCKR